MNINMQILSIAKIEAEAIAAVTRYSTVEDACPYSFDTTAGTVFKRAFHAERIRQENAIQESAAAGIKANMHNYEAISA